MDNWNNKKTEDMFRVILSLKNLDEARKFFRDLLTEKEIIEFSKRWQAAKMLSRKESYIEVVEKTGLSSRTVARVSDWLNRGMGGYRLALKRLANHHNPKPFGKGLS